MSALPRRQQNRLIREQRILDAAQKVFSETGYSGASMDAVAIQAGLSKPTLYQYFESKEALFSEMMLSECNLMLDVFHHPSTEGMAADLLGFTWDYADTVMRPNLLSLARLIVGEVHRFPDIGRVYQESGPDRLLRGVMDYLERRREEGLLAFEDAELAAQDLWGLILSAPRTQALYMPDRVPTRAEIARYLNNGLRVFLKAYSTRPTEDLAALEAHINARSLQQVEHDD